MAAHHPSEDEEWVSDRIDSWVQTYKKSMLTPLILTLVTVHQPVTITAVADQVTSTTHWQLTERGLYRTIKRLEDSGLLTSTNVDAPRTGAKRKELSLTPLGAQFLSGITTNMIKLPAATGARAGDV